MTSLLPVLEKSWQYNVNQFLYAARGTQLNAQQVLWTIKQSFIAPAVSPWLVVGSSNSVAGGMDGVDRWTDSTKLVWGNDGAAHSWIVLRQPGLGTAAQVLFDCTFAANGDFSGIRSMFSAGLGFTGGSNTTRPTAVDEQGIIGASGGSTGGILANSGNNYKVHYMQSSDGQSTRLIVTAGRTTVLFAIFDRLKDVAVSVPSPLVFGIAATNPSLDYLTNRSTNGEPFAARLNGVSARGAFTVEGFSGNNVPGILTLQNELSLRWAMHPIGFSVPNTLAARGRHGRVADLWFGPWYDPTTLNSKRTGDMYPAGGSRKFAQFGPLLFPWGGNDSPMTGKL